MNLKQEAGYHTGKNRCSDAAKHSLQHNLSMCKHKVCAPVLCSQQAQERKGIWLLQEPYSDPLQKDEYCSWQLGVKQSKMCSHAVLISAASPFVKWHYFN